MNTTPVPAPEPGRGPVNPDDLNPTDRASYQRFVDLIDGSDYETTTDAELAHMVAALTTGDANNAASGIVGGQLERAVFGLLLTRKVPLATCHDIVIAYYQNPLP